MTKLRDYVKHTSFTGLKQLPEKYTARVNCGDGRFTKGNAWRTQFKVKKQGVYFENVAFRTSFAPDLMIVGNEIQLQMPIGGEDAVIFGQVYQKTDDVYELAVVVSTGYSVYVNLPSFWVEVQMRLSLSPF